MKLGLEAYRNKVMGCWIGKNIGDILSVPYEANGEICIDSGRWTHTIDDLLRRREATAASIFLSTISDFE